LTTSDQPEALTFNLPKYRPIYCRTSGASFYFPVGQAGLVLALPSPREQQTQRAEAGGGTIPGTSRFDRKEHIGAPNHRREPGENFSSFSRQQPAWY